jgi:hypothetical protein
MADMGDMLTISLLLLLSKKSPVKRKEGGGGLFEVVLTDHQKHGRHGVIALTVYKSTG